MIRRSLLPRALSIAIAMCVSATTHNVQPSPATIATVAESAPIRSAQIPQSIGNAVNSPNRPAADRSLDPGRKPDQMLAFFGIAPGMKVADLFAGGGYTTELLSRVVGPSGKVYSQNPVFPDEYRKIGQAWTRRLKNPALGNVVSVSKQFAANDLLPVPAGSLDPVIMNMNYHDLVLLGLDRDKVNAAVLKALKPGGVYGIADTVLRMEAAPRMSRCTGSMKNSW